MLNLFHPKQIFSCSIFNPKQSILDFKVLTGFFVEKSGKNVQH